MTGNDNEAADTEILVAIGGLAGGTSTTAGLGRGTISSVSLVTDSISAATGGTFQVKVHYNEKVDVTFVAGLGGTTPKLNLSHTRGGVGQANIEMSLVGTSPINDNSLTFEALILGTTIDANDVLSIGAQSINKNGGDIKDSGTTVDSELAITAAQGTAAGSVTVSA